MAAQPDTVLLTAEQFLEIQFPSDVKAELDNGVIRMMAGGSRAHARVQRNILVALGNALLGSGCQPFGSDFAVETASGSVRYPDVSVDCGEESDANDADRVLTDPRVIVEVLSPTTRRSDEGVKLNEYRALPSVDTIALVDPDAGRLRVLQRTGPDAWSDVTFREQGDLVLPSLGVTVSHAAIFTRTGRGAVDLPTA